MDKVKKKNLCQRTLTAQGTFDYIISVHELVSFSYSASFSWTSDTSFDFSSSGKKLALAAWSTYNQKYIIMSVEFFSINHKNKCTIIMHVFSCLPIG